MIISLFFLLNPSVTLGYKTSSSVSTIEEYFIQWEKDFGVEWSGGRFQGSQPIGDCDNDGRNELLIGGRDGALRVMEWNNKEQVYEETHILHSPFYPYFLLREKLTGKPLPAPGGFAIGDLTGDGENEIAVTWYSAVYKYIAGSYRLIGLNPWIFHNGGGSGDCLIGDCDNDERNELILFGGGGTRDKPVPEVVVFKWRAFLLRRVAVYDDPVFGYAYMGGIGDPDGDGENEVVVGVTNWVSPLIEGSRVVVLDWNKTSNSFDSTIIYRSYGYKGAPFGGWCADSDMDGIDEIHVGYMAPHLQIFKWNSSSYKLVFDEEWPGEGLMIEGVNIGDVDYDRVPEVCAATSIIHILQWNGTTYVEEATIRDTYGDLAVLNIGDCDNDGRNEINAAPVFVPQGKHYKYWVFKHV